MTDNTIIGSHADYHPSDYAFARSIREGRSPDVALEHSSAPLEPWSRTIIHALCYGTFILALMYVGPILTGVMWDWWLGR